MPAPDDARDDDAVADRVVGLPDGRRLGVATYGDPAGDPVLYFHGVPGSRVGGRLLADAAESADVRLVALDRPGIGLSSPSPDRSLGDWPADVAAVCDALGVERAGAVGLSGGGPYAAVCSARLPERVPRAVLVSSAPAAEQVDPGAGAHLLASFPWLARPPMAVLSAVVRYAPDRAASLIARGFPPVDRRTLSAADWATVVDEYAAAFRAGTAGTARDLAVVGEPWKCLDAAGPVVWHHGADDGNVPLADARATAEALPDAEFRVHEGAGHLSVLREDPASLLATAARDAA